MRKPATLLLVYTILSFFTFVEAAEASLERALESKRQTMQSLSRRARTITDNASREIGSLSEWESVRAKRLEETRDMLGCSRRRVTAQCPRHRDAWISGAYTMKNSSRACEFSHRNSICQEAPGKALPSYMFATAFPFGDKQIPRHTISFAKNGYVALTRFHSNPETLAFITASPISDMFDCSARVIPRLAESGMRCAPSTS